MWKCPYCHNTTIHCTGWAWHCSKCNITPIRSIYKTWCLYCGNNTGKAQYDGFVCAKCNRVLE